MATRNDITGDELISKKNSPEYREGWDRIFGEKPTSHKITMDLMVDVLASFSPEIVPKLISNVSGLIEQDGARPTFKALQLRVAEALNSNSFDEELKEVTFEFDIEVWCKIESVAKQGHLSPYNFLALLANNHFLSSVLGQ